jgi:uncharacterized membrane protein
MRFLRIPIFPALLFFCMALVHAQVIPTPANITFTTIDVPGAGYTGILGINKAGDLVGDYGQDLNDHDARGFLYQNGRFTYFDYPGESQTVPTGINDSGLIAGSAGVSSVVGFLYDGTTFTSIQHGSDSATYVNGINNAGDVVGGTGTIYATKGFRMRDGQFKRLNVPGEFIYAYGHGINNLGQIAGWSDNDSFMCRQDNCQLFHFPGATKTEALGINDNGIIVGWYDMWPFTNASARKNGKYMSFSYPGAAATVAYGINVSGQIVGAYTFDYEAWHGFVTSPIAAADFDRPGCCQLATGETGR